MSKLNKGGDSESLGHIDISQGQLREQLDTVTNMLRQLGGNPEVEKGGGTINDPLSAPFILYVNSYTGSDKFVTGDWSTADNGTFAAKMRRISNQRLECGYTEARPFKTINRAVIEAAIITSREYLNLGTMCGDNITIVVMSGTHEAINGNGKAPSAANFPKWGDNKEPTIDELRSFNPDVGGGIILPRSVSIISADLRKCRISPCYVPNPEDEAADLSNRSAIFRMTGGGYFYGFSFVDKIKSTVSHHLLTCFEFAGTDQLDDFYEKIRLAFSGVAGIKDSYAVTRNYENRIVGPQPEPGQQDENTDTTRGSSPYIYNCSIRSDYGLCGILVDGAKTTGFKSTVIAQFTGVSLQRDMRCWQVYRNKNWQNYSQADYDSYIDEVPDNVRFDPNRRSFHIRAINRALIQEVSVFAIGQAVHHWTQSAGELTITNSNSNFGGVSALSEGFNPKSFNTDKNWNVSRIVSPMDISSLTGNITEIALGFCVDGQGDTSDITLKDGLLGDVNNFPFVLDDDGYSLNNYGEDSYIWIENPGGPDYRSRLSDVCWRTGTPTILRTQDNFTNVDGNGPVQNGSDPTRPPLGGLRVYVRRLRDTRNLEQRSVTFRCSNTDSDSRNIVRDYGLQVDTQDAAIDNELSADEAIVVARPPGVGNTLGGTARENRVELRRAVPPNRWDKHGLHPYDETDANSGSWYRKDNPFFRQGDTVRYNNKHFLCKKDHYAERWDSDLWEDNYVHMQSDFGAEDYFDNAKPPIVFDKDLDPSGEDRYLGYDPFNCFMNDVQVRSQLRTGTDYLGAYAFMRALGFGTTPAHEILRPQPVNNREYDPRVAKDGIGEPDRAANRWANWAIEFRRPSVVRMFGQAYEWTGALNYTKALPQYQRDLSPANKFTYFFTNELGGRCYISGFNEEGLQVTAAGITDLLTGETIAAGDIGGDRDGSGVDVFNDVLISGVLEANTIKSSQVALVKWLNDGSVPPSVFDKIADPSPVSEGKGFAYIASTQHIANMQDNVDGRPKYFNADWINQNGTGTGKTGPAFVTPYYLDTWRSENRLVSSRSEPLKVFVNPNAKSIESQSGNPDYTKNESRNYNSTSVADLAGQPPEEPGNAVRTLDLAIKYANASVSPLTPVYYFLGPGVYDDGTDKGDHIFEHPVQIQGWSFIDAEPLSDGRAGGAAPFMGTVNNGEGGSGGVPAGRVSDTDLRDLALDHTRAPLIPTRLYVTTQQGNQQHLHANPPTWRFKKKAYVTGIVWMGVNETLRCAQGEREYWTDTQLRQSRNGMVRHSWFEGISDTAMEYVRTQNANSVYNAWVAAQFTENSGYRGIYWTTATPICEAYDEFKINNCLIGAQQFGYNRGGIADDSPLFRGRGNAIFRLAGLFLVGNIILDSSQGHSDTGRYPMPQFLGQNDYKFQGHSLSFIGMAREDVSKDLTIGLGGWNARGRGSQLNWNLTYNNWHLMTNNYQYVDADDIFQTAGDEGTTSFGSNGPGIVDFFGIRSLSRVILSAQVHWHNHRGNANTFRQGLQGWFGRFSQRWGSSGGDGTWRFGSISRANSTARGQGYGSLGTTGVLAGTKWRFVDRWYVLQQAGVNRIGRPGAAQWDQKQWATPTGGYVDYSVAQNTLCKVGDLNPSNLIMTVINTGIDPKSNIQSNARAYG